MINVHPEEDLDMIGLRQKRRNAGEIEIRITSYNIKTRPNDIQRQRRPPEMRDERLLSLHGEL